jgi:hypothetical protein
MTKGRQDGTEMGSSVDEEASAEPDENTTSILEEGGDLS